MARLTSALLGLGVLIVALTVGSSTATFSGKNGKISFSRVIGNHVEIFTADPDGTHIKRLTTSKKGGRTSFLSDWSPDGRLIAFDSDRKDFDGREDAVQIYVVDANGGNLRQLTRGPGFHGAPGWFPSGETMAIDTDWGKRSRQGIWTIPAFDPDFDLDFHLRTVRAPGDGGLRDLLDFTQPIAMQSFDRDRPLWELYVVDGLAGGKAGLVMKLHHAISDGVGLVQMMSRMMENG